MAGMSRISAMFTADTSGLSSGTRQAASSLRGLSAEVSAMRSSLNALVGINAAQLFGSIANGVAQAARAFGSMASQSSETIDGLSKMAARLGVSYADMSGLALAADLAGVSVDALGGAMTKADRAFIEAQRGSKTATDAFARIGLSLDELGRLDPRQRFEAIAESIAALPTEAERSAAAIALFGRAGAEMLPLFQNGAQGIREAREQAERLGLTLTDVQGQNVEAMNDSWTLVRKSIEGVIQQVVANLAPAITAINEMWLDFVESTGGVNIGEFIADSLVTGGEYLATVADYFYVQLTGMWEYASRVSVQWTSMWDVGLRVGAGLQAVAGLMKIAFGSVIIAFTGAMELAIKGIQRAIDLIPGFDGSSLDSTLAGIQGFNESIGSSIQEAGNSVAANWETVLNGAAASSGEELAGPFSDTIREARRAMMEAREAQNQPRGGAGESSPVKVEVDTVKLSAALDLRSKEGNKELLRLMYGGAGNVAEEQLKEQRAGNELLEQILDDISSDDVLEAAVI